MKIKYQRNGPGKFSDNVAEKLWDMTLEGMHSAECGSVSENGIWYGLIHFSDNDPLIIGQKDRFNGAWRVDNPYIAAIVWEDSQGFVGYDLFHSESSVMRAWGEIEDRIEAYYGEEDSEF